MREQGPREHRGHVQVGDRELVAEQILLAGERAVEHAQRGPELVLGEPRGGLVALVRRQEQAVHQHHEERRLDLGHAPEAPLHRARLVFQRRGVETRLVVLLREIQVDRHGLEQRDVAVDQRRHAAVRIDRVVLGLLGVGREVDRHQLVGHAQLLERPQTSHGARLADSIELDHRSSLRAFARAYALAAAHVIPA